MLPNTPLLPTGTSAGPAAPGAGASGRRPGAARALGAVAAVAALLASAPAQAERADRTKPMTIDSSGSQPDVVDLGKHSAVFTGNVVITQGTLVIHADRVEVSEDADGQRLGTAFGTPGHPATFRQKRDGGDDEYSEGEADKIRYDSAANRVYFDGNAHLRMLRGTTVTDQATASLITYDTAAEAFSLTGKSAANPGGRTTVVFTPKPASSAPAPKPLELPSTSPAASGPAR
ncbi:MAG: lipopolysaccharide transport periplasmic protein LptA [Burkholderiaceae bacterium]